MEYTRLASYFVAFDVLDVAQGRFWGGGRVRAGMEAGGGGGAPGGGLDRESNRMKSKHTGVSEGVFCLKKKKTQH